MITAATTALFGFVLGLRHALDADHVAAVGTFVSRENSIRPAAVIGMLWGIGHSMTILIAGGAIVFFRVALPAPTSMALESVVAIMLIALGISNLRARHHHSLPAMRPVGVGVVHGLAGSAAVALLIVPGIRDPIAAAMYLVIFGLGTIVGMMLMTCALAAPIAYLQHRFGAQRRLATCFAVVSIAVGLLLGYEIVIISGAKT